MSHAVLPPNLSAALAALYQRMEDAYNLVARQLDFGCEGCTDNCCDSHFYHHTYLEWAYLFEGIAELPPARRRLLEERAATYAASALEAEASGLRPQALCPLNEDGRCSLYRHRLMICRLHGVPSSLSFPDGRIQRFPGCPRCQTLTAGRAAVPTVERASLLRELARLEQELLADRGEGLPKVKKTIADMILLGPPPL